jgi:WD40 repeat protein/tetratricopeptide (TPR) repeat protein
VYKVLSKDPKDRCEKAGELRDELRRFLDGRPTRWRRVGPSEQFRRWCKRNPGLAAANIAAAALTTILAIVSTVAAWIYRDQRNEIGRSLGQTQQAERQARRAQGQSLFSEGAALQRTGLIGQRFESLDRLRRAARILGADPEDRKRLPEIRNQAIAALGLTDLHVRRQHDFGDGFFNVDAAVERYAGMDRSGAVVVRRLDDDRELVRLPAPERRDFWHADLVFSPDGALLAAHYFGSEVDRLRIWHLAERKLLGSLEKRRGDTQPLFHPDGRRLLFQAPEGGIAVWDRRERRVVRRLPLDFAPNHLALDPDGRRLAVNSVDEAAPRVAIIDLETSRVLADWTSQVGVGALAWSADGQLLAVGGGGEGRVYVWNVRREALASVLQGHTANIVRAQFAHSGFLLATASWDGTTRLWDAASGELLATAPGHFLRLSPDDRRLTFGIDGKIGVWEVAGGAESRTLHPGMLGNRSERRDATGVLSADVSPDGRLVATGDGDGVRLWEAEAGRELAHLRTGRCGTVLFHPDGRSLISAGQWGLYRWPIRPDPEHGADAVRVGPPDLLRETAGGSEHAAWLPGHRTLALVDNANGRVLLVDSSRPYPAWGRATAFDSGENRRMGGVSVSPDGRWLAVGGWKEAGVRVWDLHRRRLERILRPDDAVGDTSFVVSFSPDGHWLVLNTGSPVKHSYHFWRVGTWEPGQQIDLERNGTVFHPPAFNDDGRLMALGIAPDQVLLAEAATGRELARLTTLQSVNPTPLVFSPDGTKLVASTNQRTALIWDLRRFREHLGPMKLDWGAPPYPTVPAASEASGPVAPPRPVRVVGAVIEPPARRAAEATEMDRRLAADPDDAEALVHRGWLFAQQKQWPAAIADLGRRLRLRPDDADACWLLAEAYEGMGNLAGALAVFNRRLERAPEDRDARFHRGLFALALARPDLATDDFTRILAAEPDLEPVRYRRAQALIRLGRHREALADLDALIATDPSDDAPYQLRSIAHEALGHRDRARVDREKAGAHLPRGPVMLNERAWILATGPIEWRDPERAVTLARRSVELASGQQVSLNTLGVALYRAGRYTEAITALERSQAAGKGRFDAFDLFFLAMAHHRLGHAGRARDAFDRAVRWWGEQKDLPAQYVPDLTRFRAAAAAVLGPTGPIGELPVDVFAPGRPSGP